MIYFRKGRGVMRQVVLIVTEHGIRNGQPFDDTCRVTLIDKRWSAPFKARVKALRAENPRTPLLQIGTMALELLGMQRNASRR